MSKCQSRQILILISKLSKLSNYINQLLLNQLQCLTHNDNIGIITNIAGSGTQMDDTSSLWTQLAICINMAHNIMTHQLLTSLSYIIINLINMSLHLINLFLADNRLSILRKAKLHLCLCQSNPELSPGSKLLILRENVLHLLASITL